MRVVLATDDAEPMAGLAVRLRALGAEVTVSPLTSPPLTGVDLVVACGPLPAVAAARTAAEQLGVRYVYATFQPNSLLPWASPPADPLREHGFTDLPWLATDSLLGPWPESAGRDVLQTGMWVLPDEEPLPDDVEKILEDGEPPVYLAFDNPAAVAAIEGLGHRVLPAIDVNKPALFKRVAAVVHHGDAATTHTAARAGTPQVIVPRDADEAYWGDRVTALGIGTTATDDAALPAALKLALAPETSATAAAMAAAMYPDGAAVAAQLLIEEMTA